MLPVSTDPSRGIQLKEGSFTFPPQYKCRVDIEALKELPRNFEICEQGIEALNDLFYEAPPEQKEGVLVQKAIWENVLERIQKVHVFNASSSYTDLSSQPLPPRVILTKDKQSYPLDSILVKDLGNPFLEKKRLARELLAIVAAVKTVREEPLFQYKDFFIFPSKDAFVLSDTETGERRLTIALYSMCPAETDESISSEEHCLTAIKDLIRSRWDFREFRRVLNANDLDTAFEALKHISQDIPTWKLLAINSGYAAIYAFIAFVAFSFLMFLTSLTPWNRAILQDISYQFIGEKDPAKVKSTLAMVRDETGYRTEISDSPRIELNTQGESKEKIQIIGTYLSPLRLDTMKGLFIFDTLGMTQALDRIYNLNYQAPLSLEEINIEPKTEMVKLTSSTIQSEAGKSEPVFQLTSQKKWGRERFSIKPKDERVEKSLEMEAVAIQPDWTLETEPKTISFQQAVTGKLGVRGLRIYANPTEKEKKKGAKIQVLNEGAYFRVTFDNPNEVTVPMQMRYLRDPKGNPVATIDFSESFYSEKQPPITRSIRVRRPRPQDDFEEPDIDNFDDPDMDNNDRPKGSLSRRNGDIYELDGQEFYRLKELPSGITTLHLASKSLPDEPVEGILHIAVPGIGKSIEVPIKFMPQEKIESEPKEMVHVRDTVTGLAYPITLTKKIWEQPATKIKPVENGNFIYDLKAGESKTLPGYSALGLGLQLQSDPNTIYFYNMATGETESIVSYTRESDGVLYFSAKPETYQKVSADSKCFDPVSPDKLGSFKIREEKAKGINQLYVVVLTDKNVEDSSLAVKWDGEKVATTLPISARSREALKVVTWKDSSLTQGVNQYNRKDWTESASVEGPLGGFRYSVVLFSGEEAVKDVSNEVYLKIDDPSIANTLYQTTDGDWFTYNEESILGAKRLSQPSSQIKFLKRQKDPAHIEVDTQEALRSKDRDYLFLPEQQDIGRVTKYLVVPGKAIHPGDKDKKVNFTFYYPAKEMDAQLEVTVSRAEIRPENWKVTLNNDENTLSIKVKEYEKADHEKLANKVRFLLACASTQLMHGRYHQEWNAHETDEKLSEAIRWSLQSVGFDDLKAPPAILGKLGETLAQSIEQKNEFGIKMAYQFMREVLALSWSPQAEDLLADYLKLRDLDKVFTQGTNVENDNFKVIVGNYPNRAFPVMVNEPETYQEIEFIISYDKLLMDKTHENLHQLREAYYYGIPHTIKDSSVMNVLTELYPHQDVFPEQTVAIGKSGVQISEKIHENLLKYTLWESRLNDFAKSESKFWIALQGVTTEIADVDGSINEKEVNAISEEIQKRFQSYFLSPVDVRRVYWSELKPKVRKKEDAGDNRERLSPEEQSGLLRFVERTMMPQFTDPSAWYSNFTFVVDRLTQDRCPFHKWIYLKSYRPDGSHVKVRLFKRDGIRLSPYPGQDYKVDITTDETGYTNILTVEGASVFQDWFGPHTSKEKKASRVEDRLSVKIYYEDNQGEHEVVRAGGISPPIIDFEVHPASVILYEVSGYHVSPDRMREVVRNQNGQFKWEIKKDKKDWVWNFLFENGPTLTPFAFNIQATKLDPVVIDFSLFWPLTVSPPEEKRNLVSLGEDYELEFLYLDEKTQLPQNIFFPYNNLKEIIDAYNVARRLSRRGFFDQLERLFNSSSQVSSAVHFKWNPELGTYYNELRQMENERPQTFRYNYANNGHELKVTIYEDGLKPKDFAGTHPVLKVTSQQKDSMILIWKISPKQGIQRGFPKYIIDKTRITNSDPVISND